MFLAFYIFITAQLARAIPNPDTTFPASGGRLPVTVTAPNRARNKPAGSSEPMVVASWYASWHSDNFTLQDVSWSKYTTLHYAFATTTPDASVIGLQDSDKQLLPQFVQTAHQNGVRAILSVGGFGGSLYFSSAVATDANRTLFVKAIMDVVSQYSLDGVDIDWEVPGIQESGCNVVSANDSANFLSFLQTLRRQNGAQNLVLSAAVPTTPFVGSSGVPLSDVSGFADVLDYIEVMNYDIWGPWSGIVGPNAPLNDSCVPSQYQQGSAVSAVKAWTSAGFPACKITLGVAPYGHSFHVNTSSALDASGDLKLYPPFDKSQQPAGDKWDSTATGVDVCGNPNVVGGVFQFWGLIDAGLLSKDGTVANGIDYRFDKCSQTSYVYNSTSQVMVSFDDATSFGAKGDFIKDAGLAGFAMWETGGDSDDILLNAISEAIGICY